MANIYPAKSNYRIRKHINKKIYSLKNMEKRTRERIPTNTKVKFICCESFFFGTVINCSEKGMCINSFTCFPFGTMIEILISFKDEVLKIPAEIKRVEKKNNVYNFMGVELTEPSDKYFEFLNSLKFVL
jgi:hypothetical protein